MIWEKWLFVLLSLASLNLSAQKIVCDEWQNLTTSGRLPAQVTIQHSNNNLDVVKYRDRYYLAFRTAPTHFASVKTKLYVISSTDLVTWNYETEFWYGADMREPRFSVYRDTLSLYFFVGGKKMFRFEPKEILATQRFGFQDWSVPESIHLDGFVPWRVRERADTLFLSAYYGKNLYKNSHHANLRLFWSTDAFNWKPISEQPQIDLLSAEEGEFIFDKTGNLFATVRLEGTGSLVCKADNCCIQNWQTVRSKTKYDSALLFDHNESIYLVSRRNLDGAIDKTKNRKNEKQGRIRNLIRYSITKKVTAIFKFEKDKSSLTHIMDFPSNGDNAYAGIAQIDSNTYLLMNYSSNIKRTKSSWLAGQLGKTYIYCTKLRFVE
jgi:hypothetical protein